MAAPKKLKSEDKCSEQIQGLNIVHTAVWTWRSNRIHTWGLSVKLYMKWLRGIVILNSILFCLCHFRKAKYIGNNFSFKFKTFLVYIRRV